MILVINQNTDEKSKFLPYKQRYRLFKSWKAAVIAAKEIGWEDGFGMGVNTTLGWANVYQCGEVNVMIMALEPE